MSKNIVKKDAAEEFQPRKNCCRFCLKDICGEAPDILVTEEGLNELLEYKIERCLNLKLLIKDERLPNQLCFACSKQLDNTYKFILQFENSQMKLKSEINQKLEGNTDEATSNEDIKTEQVEDKNAGNSNTEVTSMLTDITDDSYLVIVDEVYEHAKVYSRTPMNKLTENKRKTVIRDILNEPQRKTRRIVSDVNIYECQICFSVFRNKNAIHSHMKKHSNKLLNQKELFQKYLKDLCTEEDIQAVISKIISENEIDTSNLGEPFLNQCQLCPAVFASKAQLSKHIERHCETDNSIKILAMKNDSRNNTLSSKK